MARPIDFEPVTVDPGTGYPPTPTPSPTPTPTPTPPPAPVVAVVPSALTAMTVPLSAVTIPLAALPSQVLAVTLGNQPCRIDVYQRSTGLYLDLYVADRPVVLGVQCRDRNVLVIDAYWGFVGDLAWYDTQGLSDPSYEGIGTRWQLVWLTSG